MTSSGSPGAIAARLPVVAAVLLVLAVPAFWPAYLSKPRAADPYTHAHALIGLLWLLLLVLQPLLVRARRVALHRRIGQAGAAMGLGFVVSSVLLTHHRASRMDPATFEREGFGFYLPLAMAALFAAALALGLMWRRARPLHGRFMACTALSLVDPLLARLLFFYAPPLPAAVLYQVPAFAIFAIVVLVMWRSLPPAIAGRRVFGAFAVGTLVLLGLHFVTPYSDAWLRFMSWFRGLPLT